jgi:ribose transport system substrate-binding protein
MKRLVTVALAVLTAVLIAACGSSSSDSSSSSSGSSSTGTETTAADSGETYRFVLSNNNLGNEFRPEMIRVAEATAKQAPFDGKVELEVQNSEPTPQAQVASVNSIIQTKPAAILIDNGAGPAMDPVIKRACDQGIVVVLFDNIGDAPCAFKIDPEFETGMAILGQWMGWALDGQGSVFVDRGIPPQQATYETKAGFLKGLEEWGGDVEVAGEFTGEIAPGPAQQGISQLLTTHSDVNGIMVVGECTPAFNAMKQAGLEIVPTTCFAYNSELVACAKEHAKCAVLQLPLPSVQIAMETALEEIEGAELDPATHIPTPQIIFTNESEGFEPKSNPTNIKIEPIVLGKNAFPDLPPGISFPPSLPKYNISPEEAAGE